MICIEVEEEEVPAPTDGGAAAEAEGIQFSAAASREEKRVLIISL